MDLPQAIVFILISIGYFWLCLAPYVAIPKLIDVLDSMINDEEFTSQIVDLEVVLDRDEEEEIYRYYPIVKAYITTERKEVTQKLNIRYSKQPIIGETVEVVYNPDTGELSSIALSSVAMTFVGLFLVLMMLILAIYGAMYAFNTTIKPLVFQHIIMVFVVYPVIFIGGILVTSYYLYLCFVVQKYDTYDWGTITSAIVFLFILLVKFPYVILSMKNTRAKIKSIY